MSVDRAIEQLAACVTDDVDLLDAAARVAIRELAAVARADGLGGLAELCGQVLDAAIGGDPLDRLAAFVRDDLIAHARQVSGGRADLAAPALPQPAPRCEAVVDAEVLEMFVSGCAAMLGDLEAQILALDDEARDADRIAEVRRRIHTLKGECGVLALGRAQALFHDAESLIDVCEARTAPYPVDVLLELVDWFRHYIEVLASDPHAAPPSCDALAAKLERLAGGARSAGDAAIELRVEQEFADALGDFLTEGRVHLTDAEGALLEIERGSHGDELVNQAFRAFHSIKGVAAFLHLDPITCVAHEAETSLSGWRGATEVPSRREVATVLRAVDMIGRILDQLDGGESVRSSDLEGLIVELARGRALRGQTKGERDGLAPRPPSGDVPAGPGVGRRGAGAGTVKVSTDRLDLLVDLAGELVIAQSMVVQSPFLEAHRNTGFVRHLEQVAKIARDLQEASLALRMVTLRATFRKMARLVRDVASKLGKRVSLSLLGEETELDRTIVEEIADPLVHLIRNALDHGLEPPQERVACGKPETGTITLRAGQRGGAIVVEIEDDGRGLSRARIAGRAVERGLVEADAVARMSDDDVRALIFEPGFSTADVVTDVSGRGVGMDVVRRNVEALRGRIEIESTEGAGSCFRLLLPLTLALIDGMVVRVGAQRYVLPTLSILLNFRPRPEHLHEIHGGTAVVEVRERVVPVVRLSDAMGVESDTALEDGILVLVEADKRRCCLAVDSIVGQQQVVIKSLGASAIEVRGVSGGAILGDGRIALILDVAQLIEAAVGRAEGSRRT